MAIDPSTAQPRSDLLPALGQREPLLWINPHRSAAAPAGDRWLDAPMGPADVAEAADRFERFRRVLRTLFPDELTGSDGVIESPLLQADRLREALGLSEAEGRLLVKADHGLPVAGSIKARGGLHEVLEHAERLARELGLLHGPDPSALLAAPVREAFGRYQVAVGSTGNLGLSIGVIASALGFQATVHMSADAKQWKKDRLRRRGVKVVEHAGDYAAAVAAGRDECARDPHAHFVDDEQSRSLFLGYAAAAEHLARQLTAQGVQVDAAHPLFVYIPCGVGGAPGGIAYGLAQLFGAHVHCFFAEPVASPCFLVALAHPEGMHPSVYDIGLDNRTEADGLAVPSASECAVQATRHCVSGVFTVDDASLFRHLRRAAQAESLRLEPSATAGFDGPRWLAHSSAGQGYLRAHGIEACLPQSTHVLWTTGGLFVPEEEYQGFLARDV